jgi:dihydroneopterin triphosphate diphosphatase
MRKTREAAIFVYRGDRFLLTRRRDGRWNVPAGQIEDGESFADGAARELMEEAQLAVPLMDLDLRQTYEIEARYRSLYSPGDRSVTVAVYGAEAPADWEPTLNHEHTEHRWCALGDAIALLYWPEAKAGLRALAARLGISTKRVG